MILVGRRGVLAALGSAALFGATAPLAKLLMTDVNPWLLAGLFNLGSGVGLTVVGLVRRGPVTPIGRRGWPWLAGATLSGGVAGPLLLMAGISGMAAASASLLLNAEGMFTAMLAWFVFREAFSLRVAAGLAAVLAGAVVLTWTGEFDAERLWPPLAIVGACLCWGLDNNLTRKVSGSDPVRIATVKGLVAGVVNVAIAFGLGAEAPGVLPALLAGLVGFLAFGVSLTLFVLALRGLGAARTGAYFATAPFVGAALSVPLLGDAVTLRLAAAGALMAAGVWLTLTERRGA